MKKLIPILLAAAAVLVAAGCAAEKSGSSAENIKGVDVEISQDEAKKMMER